MNRGRVFTSSFILHPSSFRDPHSHRHRHRPGHRVRRGSRPEWQPRCSGVRRRSEGATAGGSRRQTARNPANRQPGRSIRVPSPARSPITRRPRSDSFAGWSGPSRGSSASTSRTATAAIWRPRSGPAWCGRAGGTTWMATRCRRRRFRRCATRPARRRARSSPGSGPIARPPCPIARWYNYRESPPVYPFEKLLDGRFNGVVDLTHEDPGFAPHRRRRHSLPALPRVRLLRDAAAATIHAEMHTFGLSVNGSKPLIVSRHRSQLNDFYRYKSETWSGNYQVFDGLSGDLTIAATPGRSRAAPRQVHRRFSDCRNVPITPIV